MMYICRLFFASTENQIKYKHLILLSEFEPKRTKLFQKID